jgi:hypothetical protein
MQCLELFTNAQDFIVDGGNFINEVNGGNIINELKINYINDVVSSKQAGAYSFSLHSGNPGLNFFSTVFELLEPYTCLDATKDSSARHPPPKCHPKTRLKIRERLAQWLFDEYDEWKMLWVRGSAGTGKSAVAQSFGDSCSEVKKHGASYFFSRTAGRNKLKNVVPTIVFQLATTIPEYRSLIGHQLADNPLLLHKSAPVQFRELIVEPFAALQLRRPRQPIVIILDGLDECEGESAQREILQMITSAIRTNPDLPLRWLIFSRPEAHLKSAFSRNSLCGREELIIDTECREDVERYVKDRLVEIQNTHDDITPADWPSPDSLQELLDAVSGLFVFASTCLNFIDDPDKADPPSQLDSLLTFMRRSQSVLSRNPLAVLDLFYSVRLRRLHAYIS